MDDGMDTKKRQMDGAVRCGAVLLIGTRQESGGFSRRSEIPRYDDGYADVVVSLALLGGVW